MANAPRNIVYERGPFRVEEQPIAGREEPYVFVQRIGSATVIPILRDANGDLQVLTVDVQRTHYGTSKLTLPGGNAKGGHGNPEAPADMILRELQEETGYGYPDGAPRNMDIFAFRRYGSTIEYPRHIGFVRDVVYIGGKEDNPDEIVTPNPTPLIEYADALLRLANHHTYVDVNAAIGKAGMEHGREAVLAWMAGYMETPRAADVPQSFEPWLVRV